MTTYLVSKWEEMNPWLDLFKRFALNLFLEGTNRKKFLSKTKKKVGETAGSLKYIFKCTKITYIGPEPKRTLMEGSR